MKKSIASMIIAVLSLLAIIFCVLWQHTVHDQTDFTTFAQAEANKAYTSFSAYQESGNDGDYWQGVAAFYAFQEAYGLLTEDTNKSANRIFCNEVYGSLVLSPELSQAHISDILHVMKILSENVMGENGYVRMSELRNMLQSSFSSSKTINMEVLI